MLVSDHVILEIDDGIATITFNRSENGNAIDLDFAVALRDAVLACEASEAVRCVLLRSSGKLFCGGGDLGAFEAAGEKADLLITHIASALHLAISRLARMKKPLVTAVQGPAAGAGLGLALLGDIVLAAPAATFVPAYSAIGLTPDGGVSWILPRLIGLRAAQEMLLTNRRFDAEEASALRLISRVVDAASLDGEARATARKLADGPTRALGTIRRLLVDGMSSTLEMHLDHEVRGIAAAARSADGREGIAAARSKRKPRFRLATE